MSAGNVIRQIQAAEKIAFFGVTAVAQASGSAQNALTDNTGGTATDTLAAITAGGAYAQADLTAIKNAIASLAAKITEIRRVLVLYGLMKGSA